MGWQSVIWRCKQKELACEKYNHEKLLLIGGQSDLFHQMSIAV